MDFGHLAVAQSFQHHEEQDGPLILDEAGEGAFDVASFGLGATLAETITQVLIPAALPGIIAGFLLTALTEAGHAPLAVTRAGSPIAQALASGPVRQAVSKL